MKDSVSPQNGDTKIIKTAKELLYIISTAKDSN